MWTCAHIFLQEILGISVSSADALSYFCIPSPFPLQRIRTINSKVYAFANSRTSAQSRAAQPGRYIVSRETWRNSERSSYIDAEKKDSAQSFVESACAFPRREIVREEKKRKETEEEINILPTVERLLNGSWSHGGYSDSTMHPYR